MFPHKKRVFSWSERSLAGGLLLLPPDSGKHQKSQPGISQPVRVNVS